MQKIGSNVALVLVVFMICITIAVCVALVKDIDGLVFGSYIGAGTLITGGALGIAIDRLRR